MRKLRLAAAAAAAPVLLLTSAGVSNAARTPQAASVAQTHATLTAATAQAGAVYIGTFNSAATAGVEFFQWLGLQGYYGVPVAELPWVGAIDPVIINGVEYYELWAVPVTPRSKLQIRDQPK